MLEDHRLHSVAWQQIMELRWKVFIVTVCIDLLYFFVHIKIVEGVPVLVEAFLHLHYLLVVRCSRILLQTSRFELLLQYLNIFILFQHLLVLRYLSYAL